MLIINLKTKLHFFCQRLFSLSILFCLCLILSQKAQAHSESIKLKVALYPYLPDSCKDSFANLEARIQSEFEALYPQIELQLRPLNASGSFYDYEYLKSLFQDYDIVETDSIYLGQLLNDGLITSWPVSPCLANNWQVVPQEICEAVMPYAWPHWQCGFFLFGKNSTLESIDSLESFVQALSNVQKNQIPLVIDLSNDFSLADMYLDTWTDEEALPDLNPKNFNAYYNDTLSALSILSDYACLQISKTPALSGLYAQYPKLGAKLFASGKAGYYIGYSEAFSDIQEAHEIHPPIQTIHAPWGPYHHPTLALDSLTLNANACNKTQAAAHLFAEYLTDPNTYQWIVLGEDCPHKAKARYLLPASLSAYNASNIGKNPMMLQYYEAIQQGANPMPWQNYSLVNEQLGDRLFQFLQNSIDCKTQANKLQK